MSTDNGNNELVMLVRERGNIILDLLLSTYENPDNVHFVGEYLRVFTLYPVLLKSWCNMRQINKLLRIILNSDFNIQSDAVETALVSESICRVQPPCFSSCL